MKKLSIKSQLIVYLSAFSLYLFFIGKDATIIFTTILAVISALAVDSAFTYIKSKKIAVTESSAITGLIIGYVLSSDNPWWVFIAASFLAIGSKHVIRFSGKHLFNPAALGVFLSTFIFHADTQWKGTFIWYIVVPAGLYFIWKIRKMDVLYGYAVTSIVIFILQAFIQHTSLSHIFWIFSYFYIFVMVIEPKTSPIKPLGKTIFGVGVAVVLFALTQANARFDVELASLLIMNLCVPFLNKMPEVKA